MFKQNNRHILSTYIKNKLKDEYFLDIPFFKPGMFVAPGERYRIDDAIVIVQDLNDGLIFKPESEEYWVENDFNKKINPLSKRIEYVDNSNPKKPFKLIKKIWDLKKGEDYKNYSSNSSYWDWLTHFYLGKYLTYLKDYKGKDLTSMYNAWAGQIISNYYLTPGAPRSLTKYIFTPYSQQKDITLDDKLEYEDDSEYDGVIEAFTSSVSIKNCANIKKIILFPYKLDEDNRLVKKFSGSSVPATSIESILIPRGIEVIDKGAFDQFKFNNEKAEFTIYTEYKSNERPKDWIFDNEEQDKKFNIKYNYNIRDGSEFWEFFYKEIDAKEVTQLNLKKTDLQTSYDLMKIDIEPNQAYTLFIESPIPVYICAVAYNNGKLLGSAVNPIFKTGDKIFPAMRYTDPQVIEIPFEENVYYDNFDKAGISVFKDYLTLLIQVPKTCKQRLILKGDHRNILRGYSTFDSNDVVNEIKQTYTNLSKITEPEDLLYYNELNTIVSAPDLTKFLNNELISSTLVQYLVDYVIDDSDDHQENTLDIQEKLNTTIFKNNTGINYNKKVDGTYSKEFKKWIYHLGKKIKQTELTGFIDKDIEDYISTNSKEFK